MFLSFIALIIKNEIYKSLKVPYKKNWKEYTVTNVLRKYEKLGITKLSDKKYHMRYRLTNKQKTLLEQLGLSKEDYQDFVNNKIIPSFRVLSCFRVIYENGRIK